MSRWLQQTAQVQYPDVQFLEVLIADYGVSQISAAACDKWVQNNGLTHPVLRDVGGAGSITQTYGIDLKDFLIVDRNIKIVYKARVTDTLTETQVLNTLGTLK